MKTSKFKGLSMIEKLAIGGLIVAVVVLAACTIKVWGYLIGIGQDQNGGWVFHPLKLFIRICVMQCMLIVKANINNCII